METWQIEAIFRKDMDSSIDSYSGFYENGHRKSTGLAGHLRERGVQEPFSVVLLQISASLSAYAMRWARGFPPFWSRMQRAPLTRMASQKYAST